MKLYYNKINSLKLLIHLIFRGPILTIIKSIVKLVISKKNKCNTKVNFVGYTHKRTSENRVYGIIQNKTEYKFFKLPEERFNKLINQNIDTLMDYLFSIGDKLVPLNYKSGTLNRSEFESFEYGLKDSFYHGDISKGNVLKFKNEIILIDNEFEGMYSELFQNVDYLINRFYGNIKIGNRYYEFEWWLSVMQMYRPTSKEELMSVLEQRLLNGCDISKKILK